MGPCNVFCAMSTRKIYGAFTVTGTSYLEMLQTWLLPILQEDEPEDFIMQQDGAPPHFRLDFPRWLNEVLSHRWIGRGVHEDLIFCAWPARVYVKDKVFVPPLTASIPDLA